MPNAPYAKIAVEQVPDTTDSFTFAISGNEAARVAVTPEGDVTIDWNPDDTHAELRFTLTAPEGAYLDGIVLGWRGPALPIDQPGSLRYRLVAPPSEGTAAAVRTLIVELDPSGEDYSYTLHAVDPLGNPHRVDPKIYNEGEGRRRRQR